MTTTSSPSKNPVKMIARATEFAWRKRSQAANAGKSTALRSMSSIIGIGRLLAELTDGKDPYVVAAGFLHDLLKDTDCTLEEIEDRFGREVARICGELQLDPDTSRERRHQIELAMANGRSQRAKMIVMADHIQALLLLPPPEASLEALGARIDRLTQSARIVNACRGAHKLFGDTFDKAYINALDRTNNALAALGGPEADQLRSQIGDAHRMTA